MLEIVKISDRISEYVLSLENLTLKAGDKIILENESLRVSYSGILLIKGKVGAGKSSLLKMLGGVIPCFSGGFTHRNVAGEDLSAVYLHSQPELNFITGYIDDELSITGIKDRKAFKKYAGRTVYELSGGELKKVSLLMALHYGSGKGILADEPLEMLDDKEAEKLSALIIEYSAKTPFIIACHDNYFDDAADIILRIS